VEEEVDLRDYLHIINKRKWIVLAILIGAVAVAFLLSLRTPVTFTSSSTLSLSQSASALFPRSDEVNQLVKSESFLRSATRGKGSPFSGSNNQVQAQRVAGTSFVIIEVTGSNPISVARLANALAKEFINEVTEPKKRKLLLSKKRILVSRGKMLEKREKEIEKEVRKVETKIGSTEDLVQLTAVATKPDGSDKLLDFLLSSSLLSSQESARVALLGQLNVVRQEIADSQMELTGTQLELADIEGTKVLFPASVPKSSNKPQTKTNIIVAGILGLIFGLGLTFAFEYLQSVRSKK